MDKARLLAGQPESVLRAARTVALLDREAEGLRAQLKQLRQDLEAVQREFDAERTSLILQANEQLVLAAMQAESIAETAVSHLDELARTHQRDDLTGVPNRALMLDRIEAAIALARRHGTGFAVLFVDLDRFKEINDLRGHAVGDEVLKLVARRLQAAVRESDTVSRHGGDEFVVLLSELSPAADAGAIADKMSSALAEPCVIGGHTLQMSASIGISLYPQDGDDAVALIDRADAAMYRAKRRGPGGHVFHADPGHAEVALEIALADARTSTNDIREVNERLVLSALASQDLALRFRLEHDQQVTFLAMVAHELRSPLAPLRHAAELLGRARGNDELLEKMKAIIVRQVSRMARLIDDLLEASRGGAGKFHLKQGPVDLRLVLATVVEACHPAIDERHQVLDVNLPGQMPPMRGDTVRLAQVFNNLIDNASRYTPEGGRITLTAVVLPQAVEVTVADTGIGISPEAMPRIFDLFVQETRAVTHRRGGLGIGLALVRELAAAHGGSVTARSAGPGQGSEFVVTLPLPVQGAAGL